MMLVEYISTQLSNFIETGGIYIYPLLILNTILWYALGYRFHLLNRGTNLPVTVIVNKILSGEKTKPSGVISGAAYDIFQRIKNLNQNKLHKIEDLIDEVILDYDAQIQSYKSTIKALTVSAPLLGLLGTVDGMITMFVALIENAFYAQEGGIAGGVSKALYTTEMGLIIAVPGLIIGSFLNSKQKKLEKELLELKYYTLEKLKQEVENAKI